MAIIFRSVWNWWTRATTVRSGASSTAVRCQTCSRCSRRSPEISEELRLRLTGEERKRVTKQYTANTEAYQLYLKGAITGIKDVGGIEESVEYFNQAVEGPKLRVGLCWVGRLLRCAGNRAIAAGGNAEGEGCRDESAINR